MAGHSHAANIAVRKGKLDRVRAGVFAKLSKDIMVTARAGPDPAFNFPLRNAVEAARAQSMPNDKIDYAIKKGAGLLDGQRVVEQLYEAYAPGGVALIIECVTDKPNRTRPDISRILDKHGSRLGVANSVLWMFKRRGLIAVKCAAVAEDRLMEIVLDAGADDLQQSEDVFEVLTPVEAFETVRKALAAAKIPAASAELKYLSDNEIETDDATAQKVLSLLEALQDHDDVTSVHTNLKFTPAVIALLSREA